MRDLFKDDFVEIMWRKPLEEKVGYSSSAGGKILSPNKNVGGKLLSLLPKKLSLCL